MSKKLLVICGSHRIKGRISEMANVAIEEGKKAGYEVDYYNLYDMNIGYCIGCMKCKQDGICAINDDIAIIREELINCDTVVLAAPVYFANVPGIVKNMFDRLVGAVMDDNNGPIPKPKLSSKQKYILITACNTPKPFDWICGQSIGCLKAMKEVFNIAGMKCKGKIVLGGTRNLKSIPESTIKKIRRCLQS